MAESNHSLDLKITKLTEQVKNCIKQVEDNKQEGLSTHDKLFKLIHSLKDLIVGDGEKKEGIIHCLATHDKYIKTQTGFLNKLVTYSFCGVISILLIFIASRVGLK